MSVNDGKQVNGQHTSPSQQETVPEKCSSPAAQSASENKKFITYPHNNDVLLGRGSGVNFHPGNLAYRKLVMKRKTEFNLSKSKGIKGDIARNIVNEIKKLNPPGRFLVRPDVKKPEWVEVDDAKAVTKTSQALREGAPAIRRMVENENKPEENQQSTDNNNGEIKQSPAKKIKLEHNDDAGSATEAELALDKEQSDMSMISTLSMTGSLADRQDHHEGNLLQANMASSLSGSFVGLPGTPALFNNAKRLSALSNHHQKLFPHLPLSARSSLTVPTATQSANSEGFPLRASTTSFDASMLSQLGGGTNGFTSAGAEDASSVASFMMPGLSAAAASDNASALRNVLKRPRANSFYSDPLASYILDLLIRQQSNTPFSNFLLNILLSQSQKTNTTAPVFFPQWSTPLNEGDTIPHVVFKMLVKANGKESLTWTDKTSEDIFKDKRIVIFAVPAAFNASCSETHVPGFQQAYNELKSLKIDEVYCVSVNDACVMYQWFLNMGFEEDASSGSSGFKKVKILPDGAAHFTRGLGMSCIWDTNRGYGERSWRYSAVINDMKIERIFLEGGAVVHNGNVPIVVSDAQTMLKYLRSVAS